MHLKYSNATISILFNGSPQHGWCRESEAINLFLDKDDRHGVGVRSILSVVRGAEFY